MPANSNPAPRCRAADLVARLTNPRSMFLGWRYPTGEPFYVDLQLLLGRMVELIGEPGSGKTDLVVELLRTLTFTRSGWVHYDYAATGYDQAVAWTALCAELLSSAVEEPFGATFPELRGLTAAFIGRHAFASLGSGRPPIRINPLRRCVLPDGSRESVEHVVERIHRVFAAQYPDIDSRVQFATNLRTVCAWLVAAERPLYEWPQLLDPNPDYRNRLEAKMERLGTTADPYVRGQRAQLHERLALPPSDRRAEFHSLHTSAERFTTGAIAAFFTDPNFHLEDVLRGRRLALSVADVVGTELRDFLFRLGWCCTDTLISRRHFRAQDPIGLEVVDEIGWVPKDFLPVAALRRNHRFGTITARQDSQMFEALGHRFGDRLSHTLAGTTIRWGIESMAEAEELAARTSLVDPGGAWVERLIETQVRAQAHGSSLSRVESTLTSSAASVARGGGHGQRFDPDGEVVGTDVSDRTVETATETGGSQRGTQAGSSVVDTASVASVLQPYRLGFDEQMKLRAQSYILKPLRVAVVELRRQLHLVATARARQLPVMAATAEVVAAFERISAHIFDSRTEVAEDLAPPVVVRTAPAVPPAPQPSVTNPAPAGTPPAAATAMPSPTDNRTTALLWLASTLRLLTTQDALVHLGSTYDTADRELGRLAADRLLDRFRPPIPQGAGGVPFVYVATAAGARRLAGSGYGNAERLERIAAAVAKRRADIESGGPSHLRHALDVTHLATLVWRAFLEHDAAAVVADVSYDRELVCYLPVADVLARLPEPEHELLRRTRDGSQTGWAPDTFFTVTWSPDGGPRRTDAFALEVETGFGETPPRRIGAQKAAKVGVVERDLARHHRVGPIALPPGTTLTTLVWTPTAAGEAGLLEGIRSVQRAVKNHVLTTHGELVPLTAAKGTAKRVLPAALEAVRRRLLAAGVWQPVAPDAPRVALTAPASVAPAAAGDPAEE